MKEYLKMIRLMKGHYGLFCVALVFMLLTSFFEVIQFTLFVPVIDRIFADKPIVVPNTLHPTLAEMVDWLNGIDRLKIFWALPVVAISLMALKFFVLFWASFLMNEIAQRVMRDVKNQLFTKIHDLSMDYFSQQRTGELISRINNDVPWLENAISYGVTDLIRQPIKLVGYVIVAFAIYFNAAVAVFLVFPIIGWPVSKVARKLRKLTKSSQEKLADISSHILETISGVKVVKAFATEDYEVKKFKRQNYDFYKLKMKSIKRMLLVSPFTEMIGVICAMILFVVLGLEVIEGRLSPGILGLFLTCVVSVISPVKKLANVHVINAQALAANERIYQVLETPISVVEKDNAIELGEINQGIVFDHVSFNYDEESAVVLEDINLEINKGELVAIVGPTGTGKSTLVNLIPRFYDPTKGTILIDGHDVRELSFQSLRKQIGMVTQETILFNDSVHNNIAYGQFDVSEAQVKEAATQAFAHNFIKDLPKGYETEIGDRGFRLSGGEKQRLTIARAIIKNSPVMILDEATSALDSESEKYVQEALDKLMVGRTVIAIAHRLSTILKADMIVVMEKGQIVGLGKHDELLKTCDLYKRLYENQFQA